MRKSIFIVLLLLLLPALKLNSQNIAVSKDFLIGKTNYLTSPDFVKVDPEYTYRPLYLQKETLAAYIKMYDAAKEEGITLKIVSGTRNFEEQKKIWERKWKNLADLEPQARTEKILEFSSMPATSRHHWGTDIDFNNVENEYFESGTGKAEYEWLVKNAGKFGFYQVYTSKESGRTGYSEEKWHWSYFPLASIYHKLYNQLIDYSDIAGFEGADLAQQNEMIKNYVNGIASQVIMNPFIASVPSVEISSDDKK